MMTAFGMTTSGQRIAALAALPRRLAAWMTPIEDRYYFIATIMLGFAVALVIIR
jgi:hypothetical protein